jgi:hypothetical protein
MPPPAEYRRILASEEYREHREMLIGDADVCDLCNTDFAFYSHQKIMHHLNYYRIGGQETADDVAVVCKPCHVLLHRPGSAAHVDYILTFCTEIVKEVLTMEDLPGAEYVMERLMELPGVDFEPQQEDASGYIPFETYEWEFLLLDGSGQAVTVSTPHVYIDRGDGMKPLPGTDNTKYAGNGKFRSSVEGDLLTGNPVTLFAVLPGAEEHRETIYPRGYEPPAAGEEEIVDLNNLPAFRTPREGVVLPERDHAWDPETTYAIMVWSGLRGESNAQIAARFEDCESKRISNKLSQIRYGNLRKAEQTTDVMKLRKHLLDSGVWTAERRKRNAVPSSGSGDSC